jgi:hypothetical protein
VRRVVRVGLMVVVVVASWAPGRASPPTRAGAPTFQAVTLGVRHRVFPDFHDQHRVPLNRSFPLGDTEYSARVIRYVPDFQMDLERHRVFSLSDQPRNPAFQIVVRRNGVPHDTSWAFLKSPPHFSVRSYFAFLVLRIDFAGGPPLVADSSLVGPPAGAAGHTSPAPKDSTRGR